MGLLAGLVGIAMMLGGMALMVLGLLAYHDSTDVRIVPCYDSHGSRMLGSHCLADAKEDWGATAMFGALLIFLGFAFTITMGDW